MKILILGAGGVGGYFGGRLIEAGGDVTFQVRPARARNLAANGLVIKSALGDAKLPVRTIEDAQGAGPFDLVIVSCKAYDLAPAIEAIAPHVAAGAIVLPLLNGMRHHDDLRARFGAEQTIGGMCQIETTLSPAGEILHKSEFARMVFGPFEEYPPTPRAQAVVSDLATLCGSANFSARLLDPVDQALWDKWVMIGTLGGITCLMRGATGDVMAAKEGRELIEELLQEAISVATENGYPPSADYLVNARKLLMAPGSTFMASMLRDIEKGGAIEADHIIGDMYRRAHEFGHDANVLRMVYCHLQAYEARRARGGL
ncbi:ketopantoate reductase family protein [Dongia sp.]|uniref:ketopantoate reductase family protein n=1 Tax=Dongia sp. TaxID=1977262 RepID=UPI0035B0A7D6